MVGIRLHCNSAHVGTPLDDVLSKEFIEDGQDGRTREFVGLVDLAKLQSNVGADVKVDVFAALEKAGGVMVVVARGGRGQSIRWRW